MGAAASFMAGVSFGVKMASATVVVNDALDSVYDAAGTVIGYLRSAASSAFEKLKIAAEFVKATVVRLMRHLFGRKLAAAASGEMDGASAAAAGFRPGSHGGPYRRPKSDASGWEWASADDVVSRASARVAGFGRLQDAKAIVVSAAAAPGGALALLPGSVAAPAARAARRASEMIALLENAEAALGDCIPEAARSCVGVVVAAVGIYLEAIAAAAADA